MPTKRFLTDIKEKKRLFPRGMRKIFFSLSLAAFTILMLLSLMLKQISKKHPYLLIIDAGYLVTRCESLYGKYRPLTSASQKIPYFTLDNEKNFPMTPEEKEHWSYFKRLYECNDTASSFSHAIIPSKAHYICLENAPHPTVQEIASFQKKHPGWEVHVWTDRGDMQFPSGVLLHNPWAWRENALISLCSEAHTPHEKAELLKFAILYAEGGVFLGAENSRKKSLENVQAQCGFYCELANRETSYLSSSVRPETRILGSLPRHPVLEETLKRIQKSWPCAQRYFKGNDPINTEYRMQNIFSSSLQSALLELPHEKLRDVVVFPPHTFSLSSNNTILLTAERVAFAELKNILSTLQRRQRKMTWALLFLVGVSSIVSYLAVRGKR